MNNTPAELPEGLWLAYYGDDFTGSTDVMEANTLAGVPTVLFLDTPTPADMQRFPHARCVGVAGQSRGRDPAWMAQHLPPVFTALAQLGAPILQYKVCSTFDSSPTVGSIGCAIDLGVQHMPGAWSPMVVGAPRLRRYTAFGHLFAAAPDGAVHRLDRHPSMSRHPVTPMAEADLRRHLAQQTTRRTALVDLAQMAQGQGMAALQAVLADAATPAEVPVVLLDVADATTQCEAGRLVWQQRGAGVFSASSSGLEYALTAYWRAQGCLPEPPALEPPAPVAQIVAVSGSCAPMSAAQIRRARVDGFDTLRLNVARCLDPATLADELARLEQAALATLAAGRSPLVFSAEGPEDPAVTGFDALLQPLGLDRATGAQRIGLALAEVMRRMLDASGVRRAVVAGGDSSGAVMSHLDVRALTVAAAGAPGVPLCRAWSHVATRDGLEIALKGGQLGAERFYADVRDGAAACGAASAAMAQRARA